MPSPGTASSRRWEISRANWGFDVDTCWSCRKETTESGSRVLTVSESQITVHPSCLTEFGLVVREALRSTGEAVPVSGIDRLARNVEGSIVLIHRRFPSEQIPILVYLAHFDRPVPVLDVYSWMRQNELKI